MIECEVRMNFSLRACLQLLDADNEAIKQPCDRQNSYVDHPTTTKKFRKVICSRICLKKQEKNKNHRRKYNFFQSNLLF